MAYKDSQGNWVPDGAEWTRSEINQVLYRSNLAVEVGIIRLYELQTSDEQQISGTKHLNNVGFDQNNAANGSEYAKTISTSQNNPGFRLSGEELIHARRICIHHSHQLMEITNGQLMVNS